MGVAEPGDMTLESGVMVPMRDGVLLATDIYRPARDGEALRGGRPVILERTPYGRNITSRAEASLRDAGAKSRAEVAHFFVSRGYVVVYQDCRGRYGSWPCQNAGAGRTRRTPFFVGAMSSPALANPLGNGGAGRLP